MSNRDGAVMDINRLRPIQEERFQRQMDLVCQAHPYYREIMKERGLSRSDFKSLEDLPKLPLTDKQLYIERPDDFLLRLNGIKGITREERTIWDIIYTAGSTSDPTPFYDTSFDHYARISQLKRAAEHAGITADDIIMNLFPLTSVPHQGWLSALWASQSVGAKLISGFGGSFDGGFGLVRRSNEALEIIERQKATVIWGIGFFVRRLIMKAQEQGRDLSSVRLALPMGEGSPQGMRDDVRRRLESLGARNVKVLNGYGFTEKQGPSLECREMGGFHLSKPARYFFEILDPETKEPVPPGEPGLVVMTHLMRRGTCLLRYVVGDICSLTTEPCPHCGSWEPRFDSIPYRTGGIVKIKGTLVNVAALFDVLSKIQHIEEYEIIADRTDPTDPFSEDVLRIKVACEKEGFGSVKPEVQEQVRRNLEITPEVEWVSPDTYAEALRNYKFKRFKDKRAGTSK